MALYRRPGSPLWQYDVTVDGKRYRGTTRLQSKMAAKGFEARLITDVQDKGSAPQPHRRSSTLLVYMPRFLRWVRDSQQLRPTSKRYYECGAAVLGRSPLAHVPLSALHEDVIDTTIFQELRGRPASPHLSNQALATLRRLLSKAKRWGDIREGPRVRLRSCDGRNAIVTQEIEEKLLGRLQRDERHSKVKNDREALVDVYLLMHDAGMRTSEALTARVENADLVGRRLFIPGGKSKRAKRWVPLSDRLISRLAFRCLGRSEGWLFPSPRSASGHLTSPWKTFRRVCREAGIPDEILLYTGRHTFGTEAVRQTGNPYAVADAMGHQDLKSARPYMHTDTALLGEVINRRNETRHTLRHNGVVVQ